MPLLTVRNTSTSEVTVQYDGPPAIVLSLQVGQTITNMLVTTVQLEGLQPLLDVEQELGNLSWSTDTSSTPLDLFDSYNGDSVPLLPGMPVAAVGGGLRRANASSTAYASVMGIVVVGADVTLPVKAQSAGTVTLPTAEWDAVTGQSGGLTSSARYYLDIYPGCITTTPPSMSGFVLTPIGRAVSSTTMILRITPYIRL